MYRDDNGNWVYDDDEAIRSDTPPTDTAPPVEFMGKKYTTPLIVGYGKRLATLTPEKGGWGGATNDWGQPVSESYVKDIEDTISALDSGEMSETQFKQKVAQQEGIPAKPPSGQELSLFEQWKGFVDSNDQPWRQEALEKAKKDVEPMFSVVDRAYESPEYKKAVATRAIHHYDNQKESMRQLFNKKLESENKTPSDDQRIEGSLAEKLGRKPSDAEFMAEKQRMAVEVAGAKSAAVTEGKGAGGFKSWTPEAKEQEFVLHMVTGKPPVSAAGLGGNDRKDYGKEYAQWKVEKGIKPQDIALMQSDYKAGDMSLKNMSKQEAPMEAFVGNINKQIDKVQELYSRGDRTGLRLIDLPVRELRVRAKGSGDEAIKASYLLEISNEIGKLSSGSSASIQQLSDSAKEDWKKVHDVNLSLGEIMKVINATRDQANMRMDSWRDAKQTVRKNIQSLGELEGNGVKQAYSIKPKLTPAQAIEELRRRRGQR